MAVEAGLTPVNLSRSEVRPASTRSNCPARRGAASASQGHPRTIFRRALEHDNLVLAEVTAREIGRVTIAEALELKALVAQRQPERYGRFSARWLCLFLEEHEKATLEDVTQLVSSLRSLASPKDHASALAILRKVTRRGDLAFPTHPAAEAASPQGRGSAGGRS